MKRFKEIISLLIWITLKEEEEKSSRSSKNDGKIENVRVVVRVRPMDKSEMDSGSENVVKVDKSNRCVTVVKPKSSVTEPPKIYYFDNVFTEDSTQVSTFNNKIFIQAMFYMNGFSFQSKLMHEKQQVY